MIFGDFTDSETIFLDDMQGFHSRCFVTIATIITVAFKRLRFTPMFYLCQTLGWLLFHEVPFNLQYPTQLQ